LLANLCVVELPTCTGVSGCGCFISASVLRRGTPSLVLSYSGPHSASVAEDITFGMMVDLVNSGHRPIPVDWMVGHPCINGCPLDCGLLLPTSTRHRYEFLESCCWLDIGLWHLDLCGNNPILG
jgi:hypothetical protein